MSDIFSGDALAALLQVIMIDLVLAGDNAVVIGLATAGLPAQQRRRAIIVGILAATALRIAFAGVATQLLQIIGLLLAGGILLLWIAYLGLAVILYVACEMIYRGALELSA